MRGVGGPGESARARFARFDALVSQLVVVTQERHERLGLFAHVEADVAAFLHVREVLERIDRVHVLCASSTQNIARDNTYDL